MIRCHDVHNDKERDTQNELQNEINAQTLKKTILCFYFILHPFFIGPYCVYLFKLKFESSIPDYILFQHRIFNSKKSSKLQLGLCNLGNNELCLSIHQGSNSTSNKKLRPQSTRKQEMV